MRMMRIPLCLMVVSMSACFEGPQPPSQPLAFNHALHVGKRKIPCTDCHIGAEREARASLPSLQRCLICHMKPQGDSPTEREHDVRELAARRAIVRWTQVTRNPGHIYFSHRAHVSLAGMPCSDCHGDVAQWEQPPEKPNPVLLRMDICMDCHRSQGVSNDCDICHR